MNFLMDLSLVICFVGVVVTALLIGEFALKCWNQARANARARHRVAARRPRIVVATVDSRDA